MYVAICDDEKEFIAQIGEYMQRISKKMDNLKWKAFESSEAFIKEYKKDRTKFDVLITDIEMSGINGVELATKIRKENRNIIIFFVTSHTEYAVQCFRPEPLNFFVKPIEYTELEQDIYRAAKRIKQASEYITIMEDRFPIRLNLVDIKYIEKQDRKTIIYTTTEKHTTNKPISHIQSELPEELFIRVYTSYIVNLTYVKNISENELFIKGMKDPIPVSRTYMRELRKQFIFFKERRAFRRGNL